MQNPIGKAKNVGQTAPTSYADHADLIRQEHSKRLARPAPFPTLVDTVRVSPPKRFPAGVSIAGDNGEHDGANAGPAADPSLWLRPESPPASAKIPPCPPLRLAAQQRVLLSSDGTSPQARIQFGAGQLAGCEILLQLSGTRLEAQVLTRTESSRQTLVAAMHAARERLRTRGLSLESGPSQYPSRSGGRAEERAAESERARRNTSR